MSETDFKTLIEQHSRQVLGIATRILGNPHDAQDVHQEVFLEIWRRWRTYDGPIDWKAYLYRTTVRKALEFAKRSRARRSLAALQVPRTGTNTPDGPLQTVELHRRLTRCLAKLPKHQATVFVLSRFEGLSGEKVAEILGCSQGTVRVRLHRAAKQLARDLGDYLTR